MRLDLGAGVGQQGRRPVFVGDAHPGIGHLEGDVLLVVDRLVGELLQSLIAHHADQAFVQDVVALGLRRPYARDARIGIEGDRRAGAVRHLVAQGEEILVVDRDGAAELEALAIVIDERDGMARGQRCRSLLPPHGLRTRRIDVGAGGADPAELGIERMRAAGRRQQHDRRRIGIDRFAIPGERNVIDAPALEVDRPLDLRRLDLDAGARGKRDFAALLLGRRRHVLLAGRLWGGGCCCRRRCGLARRRLRRLGLLRLLLLDERILALAFHLRHADEKLPSDQNDRRQHDCENGVLLIVHEML